MENRLEGIRGETRATASKSHVMTRVRVSGDGGHDGSSEGSGM